MKVLVTGASGFLGGELAQRLVKDGHQVRAILRRPKEIPPELEGFDVEYLPGDITDLASLRTAVQGCEAVFHLAGLIAYSPAQREAMEKVNVAGTANMIEAAQTKDVSRFIHLSSVAAVGAAFDQKTRLNEESPFNLHKLNLGYFETKYQAEQLVKMAVAEKRLDAVMLNPSTIYGPADAKKGSRGIQLSVAKGKFPFYPSGGVSVVSVDDVIDGIIAGWKIGKNGERYILSGENLLIREVFEIIAREAGVKAPKIPLPRPLTFAIGKTGDVLEKLGLKGPLNTENAWTSVLYHWFDATKAQRELGISFKPADYAIAQSVRWIRENGLLRG